MKEFRNGSDSLLYTKTDIMKLVNKLNSSERKMLKARLNEMNESERIRAFPKIRSWVLRRLYPNKFTSSVPFYEEMKDFLNAE